MNKYDILAIVIAGVVVIGLIVGVAALANTISDFVDKTKSSD